jgi:hypothetical protein
MPNYARGGAMITVYVKFKNVYGVEKVYPDCPVTEIFASIAKTKTLSENDLVAIEKLGYKIEVKPTIRYKSPCGRVTINLGE